MMAEKKIVAAAVRLALVATMSISRREFRYNCPCLNCNISHNDDGHPKELDRRCLRDILLLPPMPTDFEGSNRSRHGDEERGIAGDGREPRWRVNNVTEVEDIRLGPPLIARSDISLSV